MRPPLQLVHLVKMDGDFLFGAVGGERPGGLVDTNGVGEFALRDECVRLDVSSWMRRNIRR
jgi:hypothetical protein